jgi:nucleotide-binding universal stress UspA family protein
MVRRYGGELHMLHVVALHAYDPYNPDYRFPEIEPQILDSLEETASRHMTVALGKHETAGLKIVKSHERGVSAATEILAYADKNNIDLIVMGTHGRRGLGHLFLGSVAEEVVRQAPCPVLTIREREEPLTPGAVHSILAPVDFSEHSQKAVAYAKRLAASYEARLQLLHVVEQMVHPSFYAVGKTSILDLAPDVMSKSKVEMERMLQDAGGPELSADLEVIEGLASRDIVKFAKEHQSDLIVIATHGLTGIEHLLLGSITEKVVRLAPCPVFTVKAFGRSILAL